jgi:hypothetical protein
MSSLGLVYIHYLAFLITKLDVYIQHFVTKNVHVPFYLALTSPPATDRLCMYLASVSLLFYLYLSALPLRATSSSITRHSTMPRASMPQLPAPKSKNQSSTDTKLPKILSCHPFQNAAKAYGGAARCGRHIAERTRLNVGDVQGVY